METKSRLFKRFDIANEKNASFSADITALLSASDDIAEDAISTYIETELSLTKKMKRDVINDFLDRHEGTGADLSKILSILDFFGKKILSDEFVNEGPSEWTSDLKRQKILDDEQGDLFENILNLLRNRVLAEIKPQQERHQVFYTLPYLTSINTTIMTANLLENGGWEYGTSGLDEYTPVKIGETQLISIRVELKNAETTSVRFFCQSEDLDYIINMLEAARKDATYLKTKK